MLHAIEFHGRLCRADGRPANPGTYDLLFALHASREAAGVLWEDEVRGVPVASGGYYHTVLGGGRAIDSRVFDGSPRFLSVRVLRDGQPVEETSDRVPVLGLLLRVAESLADVEARLAVLEGRSAPDAGTSAAGPEVKRRMRVLRRRIRRIEEGRGPMASVLHRLASLEARLAHVDGEDGRLARLEDEMEDLVGPDGDVVDLDARAEGIERRLASVEGRLPGR